MYRPPLQRTVPVAVVALVALGLSFFFFAGRPPKSEATELTDGIVVDSAIDSTRAAGALDSAAIAVETVAPSDTPPPTDSAAPPRPRYRAGEDPDFAKRM